MSKRKRAPRPDPDETADDSAVKDDMVHVTPDLLAGSPDIFAGRKGQSPEPAATSESATDFAATEPQEEHVAPTEASTTLSAAEPKDAPNGEPASAAPEVIAEPVAAPPSYVTTSPPPAARQRPSGSSMAIGIVLVVIGIFALVIVLTGVDLSETGWPLFILIPGLTLLVAGFLSLGAVATVPGGIVTMLGVVLAYSNSTGDWPAWAYAWSLVVPFGVGLGVYLQALRDRDQHSLRTGRTLLFVGFMIFVIGFVLFESILGISGRDAFGPLGKAALPLLLILVGVILLVRSVQRSRQG